MNELQVVERLFVLVHRILLAARFGHEPVQLGASATSFQEKFATPSIAFVSIDAASLVRNFFLHGHSST